MAVTGKPAAGAPPSVEASHQLLVFSGNDHDSLKQTSAKAQDYLRSRPTQLPGIAATLAQKRDHGPCRAFAVVEESNKPDTTLTVSEPTSTSRSSASKPGVYFVFTGQGAQSPQMASHLLENYSTFREDIKRMDKVLQALPHPPLWTIEGETPIRDSESR